MPKSYVYIPDKGPYRAHHSRGSQAAFSLPPHSLSHSQPSVSPSSWRCRRSLPSWPFITSVHCPPSRLSNIKYQNIRVPPYKSFSSRPPDGAAAGGAGHPHAAHRSCRYRREHRLPAARLWDRPVRRQDGGGENRHLLHLVAGGYV